MQGEAFSIKLTAVLALFAASFFGTAMPTAAQQFAVLHSFSLSDKGGGLPYSSLTFDAGGNLYGTTSGGTPFRFGAVFELTPKVGGGWTETVLHTFGSPYDGGQQPFAAPIFDTVGNLYGTTGYGGAYGDGTVFELIPAGNGAWTETVLHSFDGMDGNTVVAGVTFDRAGNLYGASAYGGVYEYGIVFELTRATRGEWTEKTLHTFQNDGTDGYLLSGGLTIDHAGNLYGTTEAGGTYGDGTVFELTPAKDGSWTEKILHSFNHSVKDGVGPSAGVIFDASGNLYGTTWAGGAYGEYVYAGGTVFELMPSAKGKWTEKILHSFSLSPLDGTKAGTALIFDAAGNLCGTTSDGGVYGHGTVFKLSPTTGGSWTETIMHSFGGTDGLYPNSSLVLDASGDLYGTTTFGGAYSGGTVFQITP